MRIVFAQGPRQLLNAQTLYAVMQADLVPAGDHAAKDGHSSISQFWVNIGILANHNREQAAILFGMLFTLVIWIFSVVSLLVACIFYITFLWHHIPDSDGSLANYCRRKMDSRLAKIVGVKVKKALAREDQLRAREAARTPSGDQPPQIKRQPTIPIVDDDNQSVSPGGLTRQTTQSTFSSTPSHHAAEYSMPNRRPTVPDISPIYGRPDAPSRSTTQSSACSLESYGSDAPLMAAAGNMGYGPARSYSKPLPARSASDRSMSFAHSPINRKSTADSQNTHYSYSSSNSSRPPPGRTTSGSALRGMPYQNTNPSTSGPLNQFQGHGPLTRLNTQTAIPLALSQEYEMRTQVSSAGPSSGPSNGQYVAYNPSIHKVQRSTGSVSPRDYFSHQNPPPPQRSGTAPLQQPPRSGTAPPSNAPTQNDVYSYPMPPMPTRPATAGSVSWNGRRKPT